MPRRRFAMLVLKVGKNTPVDEPTCPAGSSPCRNSERPKPALIDGHSHCLTMTTFFSCGKPAKSFPDTLTNNMICQIRTGNSLSESRSHPRSLTNLIVCKHKIQQLSIAPPVRIQSKPCLTDFRHRHPLCCRPHRPTLPRLHKEVRNTPF